MKKLLLLLTMSAVILIAYSQPTQNMTINVRLYVTGEDGSTPGDNLFDGIRTDYFTNFCNCIDNNDAIKMGGGYATTIAIRRNSTNLSVERRDTVFTSDTTYLLINNHRNINMMLEISVNNVYPFNLAATLYDSQLGTSVSLPINGSVYKYYYTGIPSGGSYADNRFKIVLVNPPGFVIPPPTNEFKVYPNPVMRNSDLNIISESKNVSLISINGNKVIMPLQNNKAKIPNIPSGLYILNDGYHKTKLIIL